MRPAAVGLIALLALTSACAAAQDGLTRLQSDIESIAREAGGTVGVAVRHIETGRELYVNRSERFPMGSAFKIAVAVELLTQVDQGRLSLEKAIALQRSDLRAGSGILVNRFDESQPAYSLLQLLEVTLTPSAASRPATACLPPISAHPQRQQCDRCHLESITSPRKSARSRRSHGRRTVTFANHTEHACAA